MYVPASTFCKHHLLCFLSTFALVLTLFHPVCLNGQEKIYRGVEDSIFNKQTEFNKQRTIDFTRNADQTEIFDVIEKTDILTVGIDTFIQQVATYQNPYSTVHIRKKIQSDINRLRNAANVSDHMSDLEDLLLRRDILDQRLNLIVHNTYLLYRTQETSNTPVKSIHVYHDNDFFLMSKLNADRDYTGGVRIEIMTDWLKMRLIRFLGNDSDFLSHQSFIFGGEGYTPYIRFTEDELKERDVFYEVDPDTRFFSEASLDSIRQYMRSNQQLSDRPFAFFQYFARGKYRLHHTGRVRSASYFKIGKIGSDVGDNFQAAIHKDLTTSSQRVLNWDDQIAHGGRFVFNIEHKVDFSIEEWPLIHSRSSNGDASIVETHLMALNLYVPVELASGTVTTYAGIGLGLCNKSFRDLSGINDIKRTKYDGIRFWPRIMKNCYFNLEYNYRRVAHNSLLEGIGWLKPFEDDPLDDEAITIYALEEDDVNRNLHKLSFQIGYRFHKTTLYYKQVRYADREFDVQGVIPNYEEFTSPRWYGYGRLGLSFIL